MAENSRETHVGAEFGDGTIVFDRVFRPGVRSMAEKGALFAGFGLLAASAILGLVKNEEHLYQPWAKAINPGVVMGEEITADAGAGLVAIDVLEIVGSGIYGAWRLRRQYKPKHSSDAS